MRGPSGRARRALCEKRWTELVPCVVVRAPPPVLLRSVSGFGTNATATDAASSALTGSLAVTSTSAVPRCAALARSIAAEAPRARRALPPRPLLTRSAGCSAGCSTADLLRPALTGPPPPPLVPGARCSLRLAPASAADRRCPGRPGFSQHDDRRCCDRRRRPVGRSDRGEPGPGADAADHGRGDDGGDRSAVGRRRGDAACAAGPDAAAAVALPAAAYPAASAVAAAAEPAVAAEPTATSQPVAAAAAAPGRHRLPARPAAASSQPAPSQPAAEALSAVPASPAFAAAAPAAVPPPAPAAAPAAAPRCHRLPAQPAAARARGRLSFIGAVAFGHRRRAPSEQRRGVRRARRFSLRLRGRPRCGGGYTPPPRVISKGPAREGLVHPKKRVPSLAAG